MIASPSRILYDLAGRPSQAKCEAVAGARCRICGCEVERGVPYSSWQGAAYTDQTKLRDVGGAHVCEACVWSHAWVRPPGFPAPEDGKKGVNLRLYTHVWHNGQYHAWNKADKALLREWLRAPKMGAWFAAVAESGQKHVLPWTPCNPPGSAVSRFRFEERDIVIPARGWDLVDDITDLLSSGVTKDEIGTWRFGTRAMEDARRFRARWGSYRTSHWFAFALFISQRDEAEYDRRKRGQEHRRAEGRSMGLDGPGGVPRDRRESAQALGPDPGANQDGGSHERDGGRVGHIRGKEPRSSGPRQGVLFGYSRFDSRGAGG